MKARFFIPKDMEINVESLYYTEDGELKGEITYEFELETRSLVLIGSNEEVINRFKNDSRFEFIEDILEG